MMSRLIFIFTILFTFNVYAETYVYITSEFTLTVIDQTLYIKGTVTAKLHEQLEKIDLTKIKVIDLDSQGGKLNQAIALAKLIRKNKITTYVGKGQVCYSACAVIFQGGSIRKAHSTAMFMYHYAYAISEDGEMVEDPSGTRRMIDSLVEHGVTQHGIKVLFVPKKERYIMSMAAMHYGILKL